MFHNRMPRYEILSQDAMATLDRGWRRLMTEVGVEFPSERALKLFRDAGQKVEGNVVYLDPEFVLEQVAKAPSEFDLQARNPARSVRIGGDNMVFGTTYGNPFVRRLDYRGDGTLADYVNFARLAQSFDVIDSGGGVIVEPNDAPLDSRHLDMMYTLMTETDKFFMGSVITGENARDTIRMSEILFGGREAIEKTPVSLAIISVNSPLRWDDRMLDALFEYCAANQSVTITPFLLMGAMSPVTIPAALTQQIVEALAGVALAQLIRPGCPVVFGSFLSTIDMKTGSPTLGTPESAVGLLASGQIARHFNLPFRSGGALTSSQLTDGQAGYEGMLTMVNTFLAGVNWVMHSVGWLESGLVTSYEKFVMDVQIQEMLEAMFKPLEIDEDSLAFGAHLEVGHGGHFLGAMHTLENFRTCFYDAFLSSADNFERWKSKGSLDTRHRAALIANEKLEAFEPPPIDAAIKEELGEFVARRRRELGD